MKTTNKAAWILFVSRRFARVDTGGRNAAAAILSSLGIAFGVMTLIVVIAVMNGFQTGKIESILEIQSFHLRAYPQNAEQQIVLESELQKNPLVRSFIPFMEAQALSVGKNGRQAAAFIRFVPEDIVCRANVCCHLTTPASLSALSICFCRLRTFPFLKLYLRESCTRLSLYLANLYVVALISSLFIVETVVAVDMKGLFTLRVKRKRRML